MTKALDTPLVRIVDDDAEQLKSLAFLLRMGGWEVMTYQSAQLHFWKWMIRGARAACSLTTACPT